MAALAKHPCALVASLSGVARGAGAVPGQRSLAAGSSARRPLAWRRAQAKALSPARGR